MKITKEINERGEYKVIEQKNGIKVKLLKVPSEEYKEKKRLKYEEKKKKMKTRDEKRAKEKLIQERMRQIAERELEEEGLL